MINLSEKFMDAEEKFLLESYFFKAEKAFYFIAEEEGSNTYLCIKLWNKSSENKFELEVVRVVTDGGANEERLLSEEIVEDKKDREIAIREFFNKIPSDSLEDVVMFEGIIDFVKEYIEDGYFYSEGNELYGEFMEEFKFVGKVFEGYYAGNVVLRDIELINNSTGQVIKAFDAVNLCSKFHIDEDDDAEYMIEAYLESMSQYDIMMKFKEAMGMI